MSVIHISDATFNEEVLESDIPVIVDFWAEWCGPCKAIAPVLEEVASQYRGKIKITKLNIEENNQTPAKFGIMSIPTLILFKDGKSVATQVGALMKSQLTRFIDENI
jgi:thioredoxin 1